MTATSPKFVKRFAGCWTCEVDGVRYQFFRPTPGVPFKGVDFKGDWYCRRYSTDHHGFAYHCRAASRMAGFEQLRDTPGELQEIV